MSGARRPQSQLVMEEAQQERQQQEVMVVGVDENELSLYALQWTLERFFTPFAPNFPYKLVLVHAKPNPASAIGLADPGVIEVLPIIDADLRKVASWVARKAKDICNSRSVHDVTFQVMEGDARNILCNAVEKHRASVLVVGSRGHGAIRRAILGSVSDYCSRHADCTVMIVKRPKFQRPNPSDDSSCVSHKSLWSVYNVTTSTNEFPL